MMYRIVALLLLSIPSCSQTLEVKMLHQSLNDGETAINFPLISSKSQPAVAEKINEFLQTFQFGQRIVNERELVAEYMDDLNTQVFTNTAKLLTLNITASRCGCRCTSDEHFYSFDAKTGAIISLQDLFTPAGLGSLQKFLLEEWKVKISKLVNVKYFGEEYQQCVVDAKEMTDLPIEQFAVLDGRMIFGGGHCLDGTEAQMDTTGNFVKSSVQIAPYLSPYGTSFFKSPTPKLFDNLLRGTIDGKYPVSLHLQQNGTLITGIESYDKVGKHIRLRGTINAFKVTLHEVDANDKDISAIECTWDGNKLTGTFRNYKNGKPLTFVAQ